MRASTLGLEALEDRYSIGGMLRYIGFGGGVSAQIELVPHAQEASSTLRQGALLLGDVVLVDLAAFGRPVEPLRLRSPGYVRPTRRDVVLIAASGGGLPTIKRIVGVAGDTLAMEGGVLLVNGMPSREDGPRKPTRPDLALVQMQWQRPHLVESVDSLTYFPSRDNWGRIVVPIDQFFVLGDNRDGSIDSRHFGFVPRFSLQGKVRYVLYSFERNGPLSWLTDPNWPRFPMVVR